MKNPSVKIPQRHLTADLVLCLVFFLQISTCLIIAGCSKNYDKEPTSSKNVEESKRAEEKELAKKEAKAETATTIQYALRSHNARKQEEKVKEEKAATIVQNALRDHNARKQEERVKEEKAATIIQNALRDHNASKEEAERNNAATIIQNALRDHNARKQEERERAATTIQHVLRDHNARKEEAERNNAATIIQHAIRDHSVNKQEERERAATTIQHVLRDHNARKQESAERTRIEAEELAKKKAEAATTIQYALRDHNARKQESAERTRIEAEELAKKKAEAATTIQYALRDHNTNKQSEREQAATIIQHALRDHNTRKSSGGQALLNSADEDDGRIKDEDNSWTEDEDNSWTEDDFSNYSGNIAEENSGSTKIDSRSCLPSWAMRKYIIENLPGFEASEATFNTGGVDRPRFFYKKEVGRSERMVCIALAHNKRENDAGAEKSGERSLQVVLNDINEYLAIRPSSAETPTSILIPLQQISKKHWTLLEIHVSASLEGGVAATHYDSKRLLSFSRTKDTLFSNAGERITAWVQEAFSTESKVEFKYCGEQGVNDCINCGRYTLIRLRRLLDPETPELSLEEINRSLNGEE
jgi:myosin heavy subunit